MCMVSSQPRSIDHLAHACEMDSSFRQSPARPLATSRLNDAMRRSAR
jgi:hypothetical protein